MNRRFTERLRSLGNAWRVEACLAVCLPVLAVCLATAPASARAPEDFEEAYTEPTVIESPEFFQLELKAGVYQPDLAGEYNRVFNSQPWMISVELDANLVRIPYVGTLGVGAGWGWARARGRTLDSNGTRTNERAELVLFPLSAMGVFRLDVLVRELNIPLMLTGKIGGDFVRWKSTAGSSTDAKGLSPGLRWAVQAALDLNFAEVGAARALDEEWGINRTFLLFEYYGSTAQGKSLPVGDKTFSFGLGLMF